MAAKRKNANMYTMIDGTVVDLSPLSENERAYLHDLGRDAISQFASYAELMTRVNGPWAYPTREHKGWVTKEVLESLVYQVAHDILDRVGIVQGYLGPPTRPTSEELLSVSEAAKMLGVSRQAVNDAIARAALNGKKVGERWVLRLDDVRNYQETAGRKAAPGRPAKRPLAHSGQPRAATRSRPARKQRKSTR